MLAGESLLSKKVFDQVHSGLLALLRMELSCDQAASLDSAGKACSVVCHRCADRAILWIWMVRVHEIKVRIQPQAHPGLEIRVPELRAIPAHVWDLDALFPEPHDVTFEH